MSRRALLRAGVLAVVTACAGLTAVGAPPPEEFSDAVASRLLERVTRGFNANNQRQVLGAFDAARMNQYGEFRDNLAALFARYESFRAAYRLRQAWPQGERGVVIVEFELEATPLEEGAPPFRRSGQLRFEFQRGRAGWRIVDVAPRRFFS